MKLKININILKWTQVPKDAEAQKPWISLKPNSLKSLKPLSPQALKLSSPKFKSRVSIFHTTEVSACVLNNYDWIIDKLNSIDKIFIPLEK